MSLDLSLLKAPPDLSAQGVLHVEALAPLSMVVKMPGKYYRSQPKPSELMLLAMLENALGWHIAEDDRNKLLRWMSRKHHGERPRSGVGFGSVLAWHVEFGPSFVPPLMHYDDLWAQHLRGSSFPGGSRNYDASAIPLMNAVRGGRASVGDTAKAQRGEHLLRDFEEGALVNIAVLRPHFPQYYASPTPREYVEPQGEYRFALRTSPYLMDLLREALDNPAAPLYLGSNDGWVEAHLEVQS